jgi:hypothetical protein
MAQAQSGPAATQARLQLAAERLNAGDTRAAISDLEGLINAVGARLDAAHPDAKPLFDFLAIAYLRLGEQENCNLNPSASVCILPIDANARHRNEEGARHALSLYREILAAFPDDHGSRWLLNIAHMAVGEYPAKVDRRWLIPGLDGAGGPAFPKFRNVAPVVGAEVEGLSGGVVVSDFNGDGFLDIFTTSWGPSDAPHLFIADGAGGYRDRTIAAGLSRITGGLNATHADFDNDGDDDLLVLRGAWLAGAGTQPMSLLRNRGDGTFDDVTFAAALGSRRPRHSAAWADYDLDGDLDLFAGAESATTTSGPTFTSQLFRNNGNGTFSDVSREAGLAIDAFVKGATWGDVNEDGWPDLYVSTLNGPNRLFLSTGARTPTFREATGAGGAAAPMMSFATWFWDANDDGHEDLLALSYDIRNTTALHDAVALEYLGQPAVLRTPGGRPYEVEPTRLYLGTGRSAFTDATMDAGLAGKVVFAMGANFGDLDNDGWLDFYVGTGNPDLRSVIPNRMFRNRGGGRFEEVTLQGGFAHLQKGHGTAFADLDGDGDEDVFMVMGGAYEGDRSRSVLFENPGWPGRHSITLTLEGRDANRAAIGAQVRIVVATADGERTLHRRVGTGGTFGAGPLTLHVGVGRDSVIRDVIVLWPDRAHSVEHFGAMAADQAYRLVQRRGSAEPLPHRAVPFRRAAVPAAHVHP